MRNDRHAAIYFKHLYGATPHDWGVIGFPKSQSPSRALGKYRAGDLVLVAITRDPDSPYPEMVMGYEGTIFGVCTLLHLDGKTADLANPELVARYPLAVERWPQATPIDRM